MIIILFLIIPFSSCETIILLNTTQQHFISPQSNLPVEFSLNNVLQEMNYEAEINVMMTFSQFDSSFDLITFPSETIEGKQFSCYDRMLQLGLFKQANCNIYCDKCSVQCIKNCFGKKQICCCQQCDDDKYQIPLLAHTSFQHIENKDITFIIDNSDFMRDSIQRTADITIGYKISTEFNYKYKIIACVLGGILGIFIILEITFCIVVSYRTKRYNDQLKLEKEEERKL